MKPAKLLETRTHIIPGKLKVSELFFEVPVDYSNITSGYIQIFARSVSRYENPVRVSSDEENQKNSQKPWFVYLEGGPGFGCLPPQFSSISSLILDKGYQMLYIDQRGTGLSTPISVQSLALQGDIHKQFNYIKSFRADNIVRDCEAIRQTLTEEYPTELKKWTILGQSFGGFCVLTYLSKFPGGLREAFTTGGLPPIAKSPIQVYQATFNKVIERNKAYYNKYPEDIETIHGLAFYIKNQERLQLPSGLKLSVRLFLTLGRNFGFHGGLDIVHDIILRMKSDLSQFKFITRPTLSVLDQTLSFDNTVLYAILHEAIYCEHTASRWAAECVGKNLKEFYWLWEYPATDPNHQDLPLFFSGEMIYPFLFEDSEELSKLSKLAQMIANFEEWPELYDRAQLVKNTVPLYAASFVEDMYVDFGLSQQTARLVKNCKEFITNTMYHNALGSKTSDLMKELFALRDDAID